MPRERELFVVFENSSKGKKCKVIFFFDENTSCKHNLAVTCFTFGVSSSESTRILNGKLLQVVFLCIDFIVLEIM